ncbi:DUF4296 domain-containing protein [Pedobacter sp. CFBP9032]|uniref:DUF4296 domain-containing protein n=1 Tax=Pedobacter sp. CFBP9032 TaxID=3096539 RepID=UPI002A6AE47B|nr:DUF4296 domain-containing protein [Pedobacter sp. CFBP9032]MDY0904618.1 DUF4296 domain-containing protein [Pedobacter sp. CFBP9032]
MKRLIWGLVVVVLAFGCKSKTPDGIIDITRMEGILFDIHVVDGYISTIYVPDSARKVASAYYKGIYKKFDTDSAEYTRSLNYYYQNPEKLQEMYKVISTRLDKQKANIKVADSLLQKKRFKTDSLKIIKKFKADSLSIRKKMKTDSLSKVKADAQIKKKKAQADSILNTRKNGDLRPLSVAVQ